MLTRCLALALMAGTFYGQAIAPAHAGGTIGFEEVVSRLAGQSVKLMAEVQGELSASGKVISEITCSGARLGRHWKYLGGLRVPPFNCEINSKQLVLDGDVHFYDHSGKAGAGPDSASDLPPRATPKFKLDLRCLGRPDRAGAMV